MVMASSIVNLTQPRTTWGKGVSTGMLVGDCLDDLNGYLKVGGTASCVLNWVRAGEASQPEVYTFSLCS